MHRTPSSSYRYTYTITIVSLINVFTYLGEFGVVYRAYLFGLKEGSTVTELVAVKTLRGKTYNGLNY